MPKKTRKRTKHVPKSVLGYGMEGFGILAKEGTKGLKWAASKLKKEAKQRKRA
jgi:hypothetical protein